MSVITECRPGDAFVCIQEFHASPIGEPFAWETSRRFRVGELLQFVSHSRNSRLKNHAEAWCVEFKAKDGKHYSATQSYFVTEECWQGIVRRIIRELGSHARLMHRNGGRVQNGAKKRAKKVSP